MAQLVCSDVQNTQEMIRSSPTVPHQSLSDPPDGAASKKFRSLSFMSTANAFPQLVAEITLLEQGLVALVVHLLEDSCDLLLFL